MNKMKITCGDPNCPICGLGKLLDNEYVPEKLFNMFTGESKKINSINIQKLMLAKKKKLEEENKEFEKRIKNLLSIEKEESNIKNSSQNRLETV